MEKYFWIFMLVFPLFTNAQAEPVVAKPDTFVCAGNIESEENGYITETKFYTSSFECIPYDRTKFSKPGVAENFEPSLQYQLVNTFDGSSGIMLKRYTTENVFSRTRKPEPLKKENDYKEKSKRQKTTGMVLLITGMALITTSVVIANHQDGLTGAATFVYMGGPGIVLSLASIPFFVASAHNKSKWMNYQ